MESLINTYLRAVTGDVRFEVSLAVKIQVEIF
jgi:hypothetical protein